MQDRQNRLKKIKIYYPKYIRECKQQGNISGAEYWEHEIEREKQKLLQADKNRKKNEKLRRKANQ